EPPIAAIADEEVAIKNADAMRLRKLSSALSLPAKTWHHHKAAATYIKALQCERYRVEQIDCAVRTERYMSRQRETAKAAACLGQRAPTPYQWLQGELPVNRRNL